MTLDSLVSVGEKTIEDLLLLGITSCKKLAKQDARDLYVKLCRKTKVMHDPCVEDVFAAAIAQVKNPHLAEEEKKWPYYSQKRKARVQRCAWVPINNSLYEEYHDKEWGVPAHDDYHHFEHLILEGAQAGLSWEIVLKRREEYRKAFCNFDFEKVAKLDESDVERILKDYNIIKNRMKVLSSINNAECFCKIREEFGTFDAYIWQFVGGTPIQSNLKNILELPAQNEASIRLSRDLKKRGFSFVGPTIMYAYMQAMGLINDHTCDCFRHKALKK